MGRGFWAVMILVGVLILLIIYAQVQGVTRPVPVNLTGTSWLLTYYGNDGGTLVPVMNGTEVTISFGHDNGTSLGGYSGCNRYSYMYTVSNLTLVLTKRVTTTMTCGAPGVMQLESTYMHDLEITSGIRSGTDTSFYMIRQTGRSSSLNKKHPDLLFREKNARFVTGVEKDSLPVHKYEH